MAFKPPKSPSLTFERAETMAAEGLAFLAEEPNRLAQFLTATGSDIETVRTAAGSREVLTAVLEHLERDESLLLVFAASRGLMPQSISPALAVLQRGPDGRRR